MVTAVKRVCYDNAHLVPYKKANQITLFASDHSYLGLAQGSLGPFYERSRRNDSEGWPSYSKPRRTFATVTGFWGSETSILEPEEFGESFISGVPHFTDLLIEACGSVLNGDVDVSEVSEFESTLSL